MAIHDLEPGSQASRVFKHLHSTNTGVTDPHAVPIAASSCWGMSAHADERQHVPVQSAGPARSAAISSRHAAIGRDATSRTSRAGAGGPISLFYVFTVKGQENGRDPFRFVWHNTTGDIVDSCALPNNNPRPACLSSPVRAANGCFPPAVTVQRQVGRCANLASIMDRLGPVNVELGSVVSLGFNQNGERDVVTYLEHVRPRYFIPNHVTAVAVEGSSLEWKVGFIDALNAAGVPQELKAADSLDRRSQ